MEVQDFRKYQERGAYHWDNMKPALRVSFDLYLHARYSLALKTIDELNLKKGTAIDLGCGDGYVVNEMVKRGHYVFGVDGNAPAIEMAKVKLSKSLEAKQVDVGVGNVYATGLEAQSADICMSLDVIEHLQSPEKLVQEMVRVTKKGGLLLIGTPIRFTEKPFDKYHLHEFYSDEFRDFLSPHVEVLEVKKSHPMEWVGLMRRKTRIFGRKKNIFWNFMNLYFLISGKNLLAATDAEFPTYQLAICRVR